MMRHLLLVLTSVILCQCNTPHRNFAPVVSPATGQAMILALKNHDQARQSQMLAAMENINDRIKSDEKAKKGALSSLGTLDPATQKAGFVVGGPTFVAKKANDQPITVLLPMVDVRTLGIDPEKVSAAMPSIQSYCYKLLSTEFRSVDKSELKMKPKQP